jgi:hypothetical protein
LKKSVKRKAKSKFTMKKSRKTKVAVEKEKDGNKCANCDRLYNENEDWIQCDLYDRLCQNMDEESFEVLGDSDWYCELVNLGGYCLQSINLFKNRVTSHIQVIFLCRRYSVIEC